MQLFLYLQLALSSTNKLYVWGASPQVLRLQAQAQKKAKLQQHQSSSSIYTSSGTPSSPSTPVTAQVHSTLSSNSEVSGLLLESSSLATAAKSEHLSTNMHEEHHCNLKPALSSCDSVLPSVDIPCSSSSNIVKTQDFSAEVSVNIKDAMSSHSELPSPVLSNNTDSLNNTSSMSHCAIKSSTCHKFSSENSSNTLEVGNRAHVNNQKQSSQNSHEFPGSDDERLCEVQVEHSDKIMHQSRSNFACLNGKTEEFQSSCRSDETLCNKDIMQPSDFLSQDSPGSSMQPVTSTVSSDIENANMDTSSKDFQFPSLYASRRMDQNLDLKVCFVLTILK